MLNPKRGAKVVEQILSWIPRNGMSRKEFLAHVGETAGIGRSTLYNILDEKSTKLFPFDRLVDLLKMAHPRNAGEVREFCEDFFQDVLPHLERRAVEQQRQANEALAVMQSWKQGEAPGNRKGKA